MRSAKPTRGCTVFEPKKLEIERRLEQRGFFGEQAEGESVLRADAVGADGGFGPMPGQVHHFLGVKDPQDQRYGLDRYSKETHRLYGVMDRRLAEHEFFADELSVADFAIVGWAWRRRRASPLEPVPRAGSGAPEAPA